MATRAKARAKEKAKAKTKGEAKERAKIKGDRLLQAAQAEAKAPISPGKAFVLGTKLGSAKIRTANLIMKSHNPRGSLSAWKTCARGPPREPLPHHHLVVSVTASIG